MKPSLICLLLVISSSVAMAGKVFEFNESCQQAYHEILQLKLDAGQSILDAEKNRNPDNLIPVLLENYIDFFELFFNEDPVEYKKRIANRDKRIDLLSMGSEKSPYYLYSAALVHFQWAVVKIKFGYTWDAGWEFRKAFVQLKDNERKFPDFLPNQLYRGAMQVAAGTVPDGYKWLSSLLGIRGSINTGMTQLRSFLASQDPGALLYHDEAVFYFCYLSYYVENNKAGILQYIEEQKLDVKNNLLFTYLAANLSMHNQRAEKALKYLDERNRSSAYMKSQVWDLQTGYVLMYKADPRATRYFEKFVSEFKGKFYLKDALQKISWLYYLDGNMQKANEYRALVVKRGNTDSEADKQAQQEAQTTIWPDKILLRARLFSDGGYHREALRLLHGKTANDFPGAANTLEFYYRAGRIYDEVGSDIEALRFYNLAVQAGSNRREYFASRAALQSGFIYEAKNDFEQALKCFRVTIAMKNHDFKNSIDQRAKAGIDRVENAAQTK